MKRENYHHGDLKTALVLAGITILEDEGLEGLTLRAIAAKVGVSHTAPKNHFNSLKGLLTAIAAEGFRRHSAAMRQGLSDAATKAERLQAATDGYVAFAEANPALFQMMFSPFHCDFSNETLLTHARESYGVLTEISTQLDWDKSDLPRAQLRTEMMLWSFVHGFAMLRISGQFRDGWESAPPLEIQDILPKFSYDGD